jgi:type IV secretory pathway VirB10-like protein
MNDMGSHRNPPPDDDLLERYVLQRVSKEEKERVEELVRSDAAWRIALAREERIAGGVRRAGRLLLRRKLADRIRTAPPRSVPMVRYAAAAAVLLLLGSVALVNRWFATRTPESAQPSQETAKLSKETHPSDALESRTDKKGPEPAASPEKGIPGPARRADTDRNEEVATAAKDIRSQEKELRGRSEADVNRADAEGRGGKPGESRLVTAAPTAGQTAGFWARAYVIPAQNADLEARPPAETSKSKQETGLMQKRQRVGIESARGKSADSLSGRNPVPVELSQKPFSSLDSRQQVQFHAGASWTVPVLVQQRNDSLHITLYTDTPIAASALQRATLEQVSSDSFLIHLPAQTLGLQLPRGVQTQQGVPTRK